MSKTITKTVKRYIKILEQYNYIVFDEEDLKIFVQNIKKEENKKRHIGLKKIKYKSSDLLVGILELQKFNRKITVSDIAKHHNISRNTIYKILERENTSIENLISIACLMI